MKQKTHMKKHEKRLEKRLEKRQKDIPCLSASSTTVYDVSGGKNISFLVTAFLQPHIDRQPKQHTRLQHFLHIVKWS
jgi:hypothetical protein